MKKIVVTKALLDETLNVNKYLEEINRIEQHRNIENKLPHEYDTNEDLHNVLGMIERY